MTLLEEVTARLSAICEEYQDRCPVFACVGESLPAGEGEFTVGEMNAVYNHADVAAHMVDRAASLAFGRAMAKRMERAS